MWKIVILSALAVVANANNIEKFYGEWVQAAFFPVSTYAPVCIRFYFEKSPENVQCTYSDGSIPHYVQVSMATADWEPIKRFSMPVKVVDTFAEVMPALALTCRCGDKNARDRAVLKMVNKDYFIMYANIPESLKSTRTEIEQNSAYLFMRNVVPEKDLLNVMLNTAELKERRGAVMCVEENYGKH